MPNVRHRCCATVVQHSMVQHNMCCAIALARREQRTCLLTKHNTDALHRAAAPCSGTHVCAGCIAKGKWNLDGRGHAKIPDAFRKFAADKRTELLVDALKLAAVVYLGTIAFGALYGSSAAALIDTAFRLALYLLYIFVVATLLTWVAT